MSRMITKSNGEKEVLDITNLLDMALMPINTKTRLSDLEEMLRFTTNEIVALANEKDELLSLEEKKAKLQKLKRALLLKGKLYQLILNCIKQLTNLSNINKNNSISKILLLKYIFGFNNSSEPDYTN